MADSDLDSFSDLVGRLAMLSQGHARSASDYERKGNTSAAMQLRAVANLLGALARGDDAVIISPAPTNNGISETALNVLRGVRDKLGESQETYRRMVAIVDDLADGAPDATISASQGSADLAPAIAGMMNRAAGMLRPEYVDESEPADDATSSQIGKMRLHRFKSPTMPKAEHRVLTALSMYRHGLAKVNVAIATIYSVKGGGFSNALSALRTKRFIREHEDHGLLQITHAGLAELGDVPPLPVGNALCNAWIDTLNKAEALILREVYGAYPTRIAVKDVAQETGYVATAGGFTNAVSKLRALHLIDGSVKVGGLRCSAMLFESPKTFGMR